MKLADFLPRWNPFCWAKLRMRRRLSSCTALHRRSRIPIGWRYMVAFVMCIATKCSTGFSLSADDCGAAARGVWLGHARAWLFRRPSDAPLWAKPQRRRASVVSGFSRCIVAGDCAARLCGGAGGLSSGGVANAVSRNRGRSLADGGPLPAWLCRAASVSHDLLSWIRPQTICPAPNSRRRKKSIVWCCFGVITQSLRRDRVSAVRN